MDATVYQTHAEVEDRHWWWRGRRDVLAETIAAFAPVSRSGELKLAEVGCGCGGNLAMLERFGSVLGAEPEPNALAHLRRKYGERFRAIDHRIPDPLPARCHVLGMFDVLEHIPDDAAAMRWAAEQLEPGGIVVLTVPAFNCLWSDQDVAAQHQRRYTIDRLLQVLPPELRVRHVTYFNSLLFAPILAVRSAMRLIPRSKHRTPRAHLGIPPQPINSMFYEIFRLERRFVVKRRLPFGVSILLVASLD